MTAIANIRDTIIGLLFGTPFVLFMCYVFDKIDERYCRKVDKEMNKNIFTENSELSFHSPITQEEWDRITDVELERTEEITFRTPSGKEVPFRNVKHGHWELNGTCSVCGKHTLQSYGNFCCYCGADMRGEIK